MAKNTGASKFRKVDVDQFDDDKFVDDSEIDADGGAQGANDAEVNNLLAQYPLDNSWGLTQTQESDLITLCLNLSIS